jgi:hypothetical protein
MSSDAGNSIGDLLGPLVGARIVCGCDHCDAYQTVEPITAGARSVTVHDDDWCPYLLERHGQS